VVRRFDPYEPGDIPSASRFNLENRETERHAKLSATPPLFIDDTEAGQCIWAEIPPSVSSIRLHDLGSATLAAHTLAELISFDDAQNLHSGRVPTSPGLVRIAVIGDDDIPTGQTGTAYASWASPGLVQVIANSTYDDGGAVDAGGWLSTVGGTEIARPKRFLTNLKIIALATPPTPALPTGQVLVWACFLGGSLG
jgi:hypothetical protein